MKLTTDASLQGWGTYLAGHQVQRHWSSQELFLQIPLLELLAVHLALLRLEPYIRGEAVQLLTNNTTAVANILNQSGTHSGVPLSEGQGHAPLVLPAPGNPSPLLHARQYIYSDRTTVLKMSPFR